MKLAGFEPTIHTLHLILKGGRSSISAEALGVILLFMLAFANMFDPNGTSPQAAMPCLAPCKKGFRVRSLFQSCNDIWVMVTYQNIIHWLVMLCIGCITWFDNLYFWLIYLINFFLFWLIYLVITWLWSSFRQRLSAQMMRMTTTQMMITVMMKSCNHQLMRWTLLFSLWIQSKVKANIPFSPAYIEPM